MGIAANIVSVILKSVVGDKLGSGLAKELIGISIDGISEKGINEITDFINRGKSKIDSILSKENMKSMGIPEDNIDYIVAEIKDLLSKINITDEVLRQCKYNNMILKDFMWSEYVTYKNMLNNIEHESEIKTCLFAVAETLTRVMRENESFSQKMLIQISNAVDDANVGLQNISDYMKENFDKLDDNSQMVLNLLLVILAQIQEMNMQCNETKNTADGEVEKKFKNNKKEDYIKNWNSRLFLHIDNEENPLTLADAFIMPDYKMNQTIKRMGFFEEDTLDIIISKFSNYDKTATMLIQGEPGIGKSSIVSWIADKYDGDYRFIILNFRDWSNKDLEDGLMVSIYNLLDCKKSDLESKILILDGFDEIKSLDKRSGLLNDFLMDMQDMEHFKCIITSRPTYIDNFEDFQVVVKLLPFNIDKIKQFYYKIKSKEWRNLIIDFEDTKVLGIPVILYMAIMSNIDIVKNITKPELYDRIFAQKGGIFDKFCVEGIGYDKGVQLFRTKENIKKYLDFLQKVAFAMFENDKLVLSRKEYIIPKLKVKENYVNILEFPIKYLFENTEMDIEFIHKTIYEYFVSEYIFKEIKQKIFESNKDLACVLGLLLKHNHLSYEVLDFLKDKIDKEEANGVYYKNNLCNAFNLMIRDGMTYYTEKYFRNVIKCEMHIFSNMLEIIHLWEGDYYGLHIFNGNYIKYNSGLILNLKKTDLRNMNLRGADLKYADLSKADLSGCDLTGANLVESSLRGVYLTKAIIWEADLTGADLRGAIFNEVQVRYLNSRYDLQGAKVYVDKTVEIISYKQYCRKCRLYL